MSYIADGLLTNNNKLLKDETIKYCDKRCYKDRFCCAEKSTRFYKKPKACSFNFIPMKDYPFFDHEAFK